MSNIKVNYRAAKSKDAKAMVAIHFKAVQSISKENYDKQTLTAWSPKPNSQRVQWLADFVDNENVRCYVATNSKSKVLGLAIYLIAEQCVKSLYVDPKHAGQGIGTRLLKRVEAFANKNAADKMHLKSSVNAVTFYKGMGFKSLKEDKQILSNGSSMEAMLMEKAI